MTLLIDPPQTVQPSEPRHLPRERRLIESFGRRISDMYISVTDRCNFRCVYCMPEEGMQWLKRDILLTFDEIERLTRIAVELGIEEVRLTGGEPTLRPDLPRLVERLSRLPLRSLSLTTNGFLLRSMARPLAEAGLTRINVSLDTLQHDRFHQIARRHGLDEVLAGLETLEQYPTIAPIKVNVVAMRDFMPLVPIAAEPSSTSRRYTFPDGIGELGFINPVSQPFCGTCNRIRLTADGQLRTCLFSIDEWDMRGPIRSGASDDDLAGVFLEALEHKELKHKINEGAAFQRASRSMSQIGG